MRSWTDVAFVYVHIGANTPNVLNHYPKLVQEFHPHARLFLLTDYPQNWASFPGQVVDIKPNLIGIIPIWAKLLHYDFLNVANGYWKKTLFRLFVLGDLGLSRYFSSNEMIIHLESDILTMACEPSLKALKKHITTTSVIRLNSQSAIGAVIVAPNFHAMSMSMKALHKLFLSSLRWRSDMELLNLGLSHSLVNELVPINLSKSKLLTFDGAAFGQFLFGQDPLHLEGVSLGGYLSPYRPVGMNTGKWRIEKCDEDSYLGHNHLLYEEQDTLFQLFNLHIHSKRELSNPNLSDLDWKDAIDAANGIRPFVAVAHNPSLYLHASNGNVLARVIRKVRSFIAKFKIG